MLVDILQLIAFGVVSGSIYALSGIGLSLTYGILRFANVAHGDVMTLGAFMALLTLNILHGMGLQSAPLAPLSFGWATIAGLLVAMLVTAVLAAALDWLLYRRLRRGGAPSNTTVLLIASIGVAFAVRATVQFIWSPQPQYYVRKIQVSRDFWGVRIKPDQIFIVVVTALLVLGLHLFLTRTRLGKAMRATADNFELARISGINTDRVVLATWLIGGALAAAGGVFSGIENKFITPDVGWHMLLFVFAAVILGGIGSPYGALVGGLVIGISAEVATLVINPVYKQAVAFLIMVAVLLWRPTGIFGQR